MTDAFMDDARFEKAFQVVFAHEGGFVDDPDDPGGATNWGWSLRTLRVIGDADNDGWSDGDLDRDGDVDVDDIRQMAPDDAKKLYWMQFWRRYRYHAFELVIGIKLFDLSVNMGPGQAHRILQRAVRAAGGEALTDDGLIGPKTLAAVRERNADVIRCCMRSEAAGFYRGLIVKNPVLEKYRAGWLNRAYF